MYICIYCTFGKSRALANSKSDIILLVLFCFTSRYFSCELQSKESRSKAVTTKKNIHVTLQYTTVLFLSFFIPVQLCSFCFVLNVVLYTRTDASGMFLLCFQLTCGNIWI